LSEIRKDYFTSKIVLVSTKRDNPLKPKKEHKSKPLESKRFSDCGFCPGNEEKTPPADTVLVQKEGALIKLADEEGEPVKNWVVRVFPSNKPAVCTDPEPAYSDRPLYSEPAYGHHYVVVATPNHLESFAEMSPDQMASVLTIVQDKVRWLYGRKKVSYVAVFVDALEGSDRTHTHPHLQILTLPRLPPLIEQEAVAVQKSMYDLGICPMCTVVNVESGGPRQILSTDFFIAIAPWAPSHSYEFWIFPKQHQTSFLKATQKEVADLAKILRCTLGGMAKVLDDAAFNLVFHISSEKKTTRQVHWHIEVYPKRSRWGGIERGMGVFINPVSPEQVAEDLGEYSRREFAHIIGVK
jgi:UDPglucose--hexose-1-phosphate uridylyltransferase